MALGDKMQILTQNAKSKPLLGIKQGNECQTIDSKLSEK